MFFSSLSLHQTVNIRLHHFFTPYTHLIYNSVLTWRISFCFFYSFLLLLSPDGKVILEYFRFCQSSWRNGINILLKSTQLFIRADGAAALLLTASLAPGEALPPPRHYTNVGVWEKRSLECKYLLIGPFCLRQGNRNRVSQRFPRGLFFCN